MATFNPYENAIKESINVDFRNRYSPQKVILCNRENQFYGTFFGKLNACSVDINGGIIKNVELSNVNLSGIFDNTCISNWLESNFVGFPNVDQENIVTKKNMVVNDSLSAVNGNISNLTVENIVAKSLDGTIESLSDAISSKVFIVNGDSGLSGHSDLSVVKLSKDDYEDLVLMDACNDRTLYVVNSDVEDAYGQRIVNVANAKDLSDAVNLGQLNKLSTDMANDTANILSGILSGCPEMPELSGDWESLQLSTVAKLLHFVYQKFGGAA